MGSCMGISGNWRTVVRNLAVRVSRRKLRGTMPTSTHRLNAGLIRKALVMNRTAEFWMVESQNVKMENCYIEFKCFVGFMLKNKVSVNTSG